jgi:hypothetical protein
MMDTESLIRTLAQDRADAVPMPRAWALAAGIAAILAAMAFWASTGPRPDIADAAGTVRFLFKFVVTLSLFATALWALSALARPGADARAVLPALLVAPSLLLIAIGMELMAISADQIGPRWIGNNSLVCVTSIPLIGIGPLAAFLLALRHGAPDRPALAGALAGIVAGGLAATFYAAHCADDSPLFVATWYTLAIALLAVVGAAAGRVVARW